MKIQKHDGTYSLTWEYAIKSNMTIKDDKEYWFYNTTFPGVVYEFFKKDLFFLYTNAGKMYLSPDEPVFPSTKVKLFKKGNQSARNMTLSKKIFLWEGQVHGVIRYTLYLEDQALLEIEPLLTV